MERAALPGRLSTPATAAAWRLGTVTGLIEEARHAKTILLDVPSWPGDIAGQHLEVRLTAKDGYQTERSYSIASAPKDPAVGLMVRIDDGEVFPYLTHKLRVGDEVDPRGPLGGYFFWQAPDGGPVLPIAGGSGLVPLMAMLRGRTPAREHPTRDCACPPVHAKTRCTTRSSRSYPPEARWPCTTRSTAVRHRDGGTSRRGSMPTCRPKSDPFTREYRRSTCAVRQRSSSGLLSCLYNSATRCVRSEQHFGATG
jgi:Oxidoreductase FAD-binding domain